MPCAILFCGLLSRRAKLKAHHELGLIAALALLNFGLSLAYLSLGRSLWLDESFSWLRVIESWEKVFANVLPRQWFLETRDLHPPLYFAFAKLWGAWAGADVFMFRFVSALGIALTVPLAWASARRLFDAPTARLTALMAAISPTYLWQAGEVARHLAVRLGPEARIVTVFPDRMERYFSTELFARETG